MEEVILKVKLYKCPVTGSPSGDSYYHQLLWEIKDIFTLHSKLIWEVNVEMMEHCFEHDTILIAEVTNYITDLEPEDAKRTGKVLSVSKEQFKEFYVDIKPPVSKYLFASTSVFESLDQRFFPQ